MENKISIQLWLNLYHDAIKKIGVVMDCDFKLDKQINSVVKSSFFPIETSPQGEIFPVF